MKQRASFGEELDKLFNILVCDCHFICCAEAKCLDEACTSVHIDCNCPRDSKVPKLELPYLKDQREKVGKKGNFQMGSKDAKETANQVKQIKKRELEAERIERREAKRRHEEEELLERVKAAEEEEAEIEGENVALNEESMTEVDVDPTFQCDWVDRQRRSEAHQQNRTPLPTVASIAARGEGSRRFVAAIATATLIDYNIITPDNKSQIITKE